MNQKSKPGNHRLKDFQERVKELNCLYRIEDQLKDSEANLHQMIENIIATIPDGWQYPKLCQVKIELKNKVIQSPDFRKTPWFQNAEIKTSEKIYGTIQIFYTRKPSEKTNTIFLKEEEKLLNTIADRIAQFIWSKELKQMISKWKKDDLRKNNEA